MAIIDYKGTKNADTVKRKDLDSSTEWARYYGLEGDDYIEWTDGEVFGGAGNDTIVRPVGAVGDVYVVYYDSPSAITADLGAGYVMDGWGTKDTLVNIHAITASGKNDTIYGSSQADVFSVNWGKVFVDGRGGFDHVHIEGPASQWDIKTSADGRVTWVTNIAKPTERVFELHNVERINFWNTNNEFVNIKDLIDRSQIGSQALVESNDIRWNASGALGSAAKVTFSFTDSAPTYGNGNGGTGNIVWTTAQKASVRAALAILESTTQLSFQEVTDSASSFGQMRFGINQQTESKAYSFLPDTKLGDLAGDIWLSSSTAENLSKGNAGWTTLLHEIAHALGLKQALDSSYTGDKVILIDEQNDSRYTLMSNNDVMNGVVREDFGMHDISALRYLYGTKNVATGDNKYTFTDSFGSSQLLIVDDGGNNSIDASTVSAGARIDLRAGFTSSIGRDAQDNAVVDNLTIALGTKINAATGTDYDDVLIGNEFDNLFTGLSGNDQVDGAAGIDTFRIVGASSDYLVSYSSFSGKVLVSAADGFGGTDSLAGVELLQFSDGLFNIVLNNVSSQDNDILIGSAGADKIDAQGSNDILIGGAGDDQLDGGAGNDVARYVGGRDNFEITRTATGLTIRDRTSAEGVDTVSNVEQLRFADMNINLGIAALSKTIAAKDLQLLEELYVAFFNRVPDADGLGYWIGQLKAGSSINNIAESFYGAAVYFSNLTGYTATMTNDEFVKIIYRNVLGRSGATAPPDADVQYWSNELATGHATRGSLIGTMLTAAHSFKGDATWGWVPDLLDNKLTVANFFAVQQGLNFNTPEDSIVKGMAIAAAVSATDISAALKLIGVSDMGFNLLV